MSTFHDLHSDLTAAYQRTTKALNSLAELFEGMPGTSSAAKPAKPSKPKPKSRKPAALERNGVLDVPGAGF